MHVGGEGTVWLSVESELNQSVPSFTVHRCIPGCPSKENWYLQRELASVAHRAKRRVNGVALLDPLDSASGMPQLSKLSILCAFCQLSSKVLAQLASAVPQLQFTGVLAACLSGRSTPGFAGRNNERPRLAAIGKAGRGHPRNTAL